MRKKTTKKNQILGTVWAGQYLFRTARFMNLFVIDRLIDWCQNKLVNPNVSKEKYKMQRKQNTKLRLLLLIRHSLMPQTPSIAINGVGEVGRRSSGQYCRVVHRNSCYTPLVSVWVAVAAYICRCNWPLRTYWYICMNVCTVYYLHFCLDIISNTSRPGEPGEAKQLDSRYWFPASFTHSLFVAVAWRRYRRY